MKIWRTPTFPLSTLLLPTLTRPSHPLPPSHSSPPAPSTERGQTWRKGEREREREERGERQERERERVRAQDRERERGRQRKERGRRTLKPTQNANFAPQQKKRPADKPLTSADKHEPHRKAACIQKKLSRFRSNLSQLTNCHDFMKNALGLMVFH